MGVKFRITKKSGEIAGFKSVGRKSGEGVKNWENPEKIGRVERYGILFTRKIATAKISRFTVCKYNVCILSAIALIVKCNYQKE